MFFALSQPSRKKAVRGNKGRGSKGSRMSTQSNLTTASEDISMIDVDMNEGASVSKQELELLTSFKATKGAKKGVKGKKAAPKSKRKVPTEHQEELVPGSSFVEPEDDDFEIKVEQKPSPTTTGEKRKSDHMSVDADSMQPEMKHDQPQPQIPPPKRRATRSSVSRANKAANRISDTSQDENSRMTDAESMPPPLLTVSKKAAKGGKKRGSSNARKASAASTASKASLRAAIPDDEEIDAALEADLDRPLTDDEIDSDPPTVRKTKTRRLTRTKPGSRNITASIAPVGRATSASALPVEGESMASVDASVSDSQMGVVEESKAVEIALTAIDHAKQELIAETDKHMASKAKTRGRPRSKTTKAARKGKTTEQDSHNIKNSEAIPQVSPLPTRPPQVPESEQKSVQLPGITARMSDVSVESLKGEQAIEVDSSVLAPSVVHEISAVEAQDGHASQNRVKKGGKPRGAAAKKGKAVKKGVAASQSNRSIIQIETEDPGRNDPAVLVGVETLDDHENAGEPTWLMVAPAKDVAKSKVKGTKGEKRTVESSRKSDTRLSSEASSVSRAEPVKVPSVATQEHIAVAGIPTPADSRGQDDGHKVSVRSPTPPVQPPSGHRTPKTVNSPQSSDAENQPPSSRPSALRPPLLIQTPSKMHTARVPLAVTTPAASPSKRNISRLQTSLPWTSIDFDQILKLPAADKENVSGGGTGGLEQGLSSPEKKLTVEEWIRWNAKRGEDQLREDCERLVGKFEDQGVRALNTLEGIVCAE